MRDRLAEPAFDVVIAGAGRQPTGRFLDLSQEQWDASVAGAMGAFHTAQRAAAEWERAGAAGRIVFLVSTTSLRPVHGAALDATVGGFLSTIGQVGAVELGGEGDHRQRGRIRLDRRRGHGGIRRRDSRRAPRAPRGDRGGGRLPRLGRRVVRERRRARGRRRLLDHEDGRGQPAARLRTLSGGALRLEPAPSPGGSPARSSAEGETPQLVVLPRTRDRSGVEALRSSCSGQIAPPRV